MEPSTIMMPRRPSRPAALVRAVPRPGDRLGRYRLCLQLASGGMSTVFLARAEGGAGVHRYVALKCLRPEPGAGEWTEMFLDEARLTSQIQHPHVCSVIDCDVQDRLSYLVMEYLQGQCLAAVRGSMANHLPEMASAHRAGLVARIIADAAEGLHAAHELTDGVGQPLNVVHRDVSPENIFLTYEGNVKVMDFGVALSSGQLHRTRPGVLKGKCSYLPPEVLRGVKPDRRADIWGLGIVLWELLTTKQLFDFGTEVEAIHAIIEMPIPKPSQVCEGIPAELDEVALRALQRNPNDRYQSARELGRQLMRFLAEHRLSIGLAELAELMEQLYPNGRACSRQRLHTLDEMESSAAAGEAGTDEARSTVEREVVMEPETTAQASPGISVAPLAVERRLPAGRAPETPAGRPSAAARWTLAPALVAVALLVAALAWYAGRAMAVPRQPAHGAPAPASERAPQPASAEGQSGVSPGPWAARYRLEVQPVASDDTGEVLLRVRVVEDPVDAASAPPRRAPIDSPELEPR